MQRRLKMKSLMYLALVFSTFSSSYVFATETVRQDYTLEISATMNNEGKITNALLKANNYNGSQLNEDMNSICRNLLKLENAEAMIYEVNPSLIKPSSVTFQCGVN